MTDQENNNSISQNPFAALFSSVADAKQFASVQKQQLSEEALSDQDDSDNSVSESLDDYDDSVAEISRSFRSQQELCEQLNINHMLQRIFLITLDNSDPSLKGGNGIPMRCVYLEEMAADLDGQDWLDMENVEQAVFSRLLLPEPGNHLIYMTSVGTQNLSADRDAGEKHIIPYLNACFQRAKEEITKVPENLLPYAIRCKNLIVSNSRTVFLTPEIYENQNIHDQLLDLLLEAIRGAQLEEVTSFLEEVIEAITADEEVRTFTEVIMPLFDVILGRVKDLDLCQMVLYTYLDVLLYFTRQKDIAMVFVDYIQPKDPLNGHMYQKTLLGTILNISCMLKTPGVVENHGYFLSPSRSSPQEIKVQESNIHQFMSQFHEKIYQMLKNLLQLSPETKQRILSWLGNCLHANAGRTKIWANQMPDIFFQMYASDAFFLNLGAALLKLCQPFCKPKSPRLLTFNPTYCALKELNEEERKIKNAHMKGLDKETCLIPAATDQQLDIAQSYNLVTENLVLTQYTLHLGFHRLHDQMVKMNQSLHRLQVSWREAQQSSSPTSEALLEQFERLMTVYLSTKTIMTEPQMLQNCLNLQVSMALLLVQFAIGNQGTEPIELTFPLPEVQHSMLAFVPGPKPRTSAQVKPANAPRTVRAQDEGHTSVEHPSPPPPPSPPPRTPTPPPSTAASPSSNPPPLPPQARRAAVSSLQIMEFSDNECLGGQESPGAEVSNLSQNEPQQTGARRRRVRPASPSEGDEHSVFAGLEISMVKVQRLQAKAIMSVQRQMWHMNANIQNIDKSVNTMNTTLAEGLKEMSDSVRLLCSKFDQDRMGRRRERQMMAEHTKAVNRLSNATSLLCRRSLAIQEEMSHCSRDVARGLLTVTTALDMLQRKSHNNTGASEGGDSEEATSRSSVSPQIAVPRRRSGRHIVVTGQPATDETKQVDTNNAVRVRRK